MRTTELKLTLLASLAISALAISGCRVSIGGATSIGTNVSVGTGVTVDSVTGETSGGVSGSVGFP